MIDLEKLIQVPFVDTECTFDASLDGQKVAFAWNKTGQWEIYELLLDGASPPLQVSRGEGAKFSPRYSPDGMQLAYMVDFDGGENFRLFVLDLTSGKHTALTPDETGALQPDYAWSPDGTEIAILSNRSGCFNTYVMPATGGPDRLVLDTDFPDTNVHWSPDGRWLLVVAGTRGSDYGAFIVPAAGGGGMQIADAQGPLSARDAVWSPDSQRVAFASDSYGVYAIGIYSLGSGNLAWLAQGDAEVSTPVWSADGRRLVYVCHKEAVNHLVVQDLQNETSRNYAIAPGLHTFPNFIPGGDALLCVFNNPRQPDDLWLVPLESGSPRQLTHSLPSDLQAAPFGMPEHIYYPGMDGTPVPALLYRPPAQETLSPAVVLVHGGPNWRYDSMWYPFVQHMLSRGWLVLQPNYRGSTGYGRDWQYASRYDQGGVDTADVVAGALYLIRRNLADPARIAVTGTSHGGYLTMTSLTQFPDIWVAGSAVVPFLNWFTSHPNSRDDLRHWDRENFGDPVKDHDLWYARSPFFFLDRVKAPVQLICGGNDPRCPASESIAARDALQAMGKPVDFTIYLDEGHSFLKTANVVDAALRRIAFLAHALG